MRLSDATMSRVYRVAMQECRFCASITVRVECGVAAVCCREMTLPHDLPRDLVDCILNCIDDIDTRRALALRPRRVRVPDGFARAFAAMPKPVIDRYSARVALGPIRCTYLVNYDALLGRDVFIDAPMYTMERYADANCWDDYFIFHVEHVERSQREHAVGAPGRPEVVEHIDVQTADDEWYSEEWDGTEEHYRRDSYRARMGIPIR